MVDHGQRKTGSRFKSPRLRRSAIGTGVVAAAIAALATGATPAMAGPIKSLLLGDDVPGTNVGYVLSQLTGADSRFDHAGSAGYNLSAGLPLASYLSQFDSIIVYTNFNSVDHTDLSNLLGNYVVAGGGFVISTFWGQGAGSSGGLLNSHGFNPLINPTYDAYQANTLGSYDPADPLLANVHTLAALVYDADYLAGLDAGATLAASWSNGRPLAAYNAAHKVAAVTLFPNGSYGHATGDFAALFANALAFTAGDVGTGVVPDPASWVLMIGGFGLVGGLARMRRSTGPSVVA